MIMALLGTALAATIAVEPPMELQEKGWAPVVVSGVTLPPFAEGEEGTCTVVVQLVDDEERRVTPTTCDTVFEDRSVQSTHDWDIAVGDKQFLEQEAGLTVNYVFTGTEVRLSFDEGYLRSPIEKRPAMVDTSSFSIARTAVPRYPKELLGSGRAAKCTVSLTVSRGGKPKGLDFVDCPDEFRKSASAAIRKWRWDPPLTNGERVERKTRVTVKFKAQ